jgi:tetratricopeptide (TPR) repeat protein
MASALLALLAWRCWRDPKINFLPSDGRAEWIVFPAPLDLGAKANLCFDVIFQSQFSLNDQPRAARLYLRAAKRSELRINGVRVDTVTSRNWKDTSTIDVLSFLQAGTNLIEVRVFNDNGPPALWLRWEADQFTLRSDQTWQTCFAGSAWRSAALASTPRALGGDNPATTGERIFNSLSIVWPIWAVFGGIAFLFCIIQKKGIALPQNGSRQAMVLLFVAVLWVLLFLNNTVRTPFYTGFDAKEHLDYIKYVQERHTLPLPSEGFEMFQPPLYYVLSALALSAGGLSIASASAVFVLRSLTMLVGIAQFTLVFLILRLLFPRRFDLQLCGVMLAAFVPMQLYMSHYVTNETLGAVLVTATFYLGLRILKNEQPALLEYVCLGFSLGLAILAKATGVLLFPFLVIALAIKVTRQQLPVATRIRNLGVMLAACLAVCGWQYLRIGLRSDTPFLGVAGKLSFWQDQGYHTVENFVRFGRSLITPLFAGSRGFADGIYSTLWGDGLCGGQSYLDYRPPWNYDLMIAGYLLALVPTALLLVGLVTAVGRFVRKPSTELFLFLGLSAAIALGLILLSIRVPSYAQGKAFYGLSILAPLSFFAALGWEVVTRRRTFLQLVLGTILLMWLMNSFASFWIRDTPFQEVYVGHKMYAEKKVLAAAAQADQAVAHYPSSGSARRFRSLILNELGRTKEASQEAARATELEPTDASSHLQLALILAQEGEADRAIDEARRALDLAPTNPTAYDVLSNFFLGSRRLDQAADMARDGLAVSPLNARLHFTLGEALVQKNDYVTAANHFAYALLLRSNWTAAHSSLHRVLGLSAAGPDGLKNLERAASSAPDSPAMLDPLAWWFATNPEAAMRNGQEAVRLAERACELTHRKGSRFLNTLAAAYGETGRFSDAIRVVQDAISLARSSGQEIQAALGQELLASFQANRPYRAEPVL